MQKLFHLPGWLLLRLLWPIFSRNHSWKMRREFINYKCYSLEGWIKFVLIEMKPHEKIMQIVIVNGGIWGIIIFYLYVLFSTTAKS